MFPSEKSHDQLIIVKNWKTCFPVCENVSEETSSDRDSLRNLLKYITALARYWCKNTNARVYI